MKKITPMDIPFTIAWAFFGAIAVFGVLIAFLVVQSRSSQLAEQAQSLREHEHEQQKRTDDLLDRQEKILDRIERLLDTADDRFRRS
jgi:cell division protein FtsL